MHLFYGKGGYSILPAASLCIAYIVKVLHLARANRALVAKLMVIE